jgi:hypothetical protein
MMVEMEESFSLTVSSVGMPCRMSISFLVSMLLLLRRHMNLSLQLKGTMHWKRRISSVNSYLKAFSHAPS